MNKPKYLHDCESCVFLGAFQNETDVDLYWCRQNGSPTIIARFSDEGSDYESGILSGLIDCADPTSSIGEAYRLAVIRGFDVGVVHE